MRKSLVIVKQNGIFVLERIEEVEGERAVFKLKKEGQCYFDDFINQCKKEGNWRNQLVQIQTRLEFIARGEERKLPVTKFKELKGRKKADQFKDFEIKTKDLRVYLFHDNRIGKVVILGGKKKSQLQDIEKMRRLKVEYFKN